MQIKPVQLLCVAMVTCRVSIQNCILGLEAEMELGFVED